MWFYLLLFAAGLALLIKGADWVSDYGSKIAKALGVSELVIGITLVAIATSLPELAVSVISAISQTATIATGTIIGSNISNIGLIIGISALVAPLTTRHAFVRQEYVMLIFSFAGALFLLDGMFWYEGIVLLAGLIIYMYYLIGRRGPRKADVWEWLSGFVSARFGRKPKTPARHIAYCIAGGIAVVAGAEMLIYSTVSISQSIGVSELLISLIAIAVGTSLPELAVSVTAALKGMRGISIGNIIGSNIFNLAILGIASLFAVVPVAPLIILVDLPIMIALSIMLLFFMKSKWEISRGEGAVLLIVYLIFVCLQFA